MLQIARYIYFYIFKERYYYSLSCINLVAWFLLARLDSRIVTRSVASFFVMWLGTGVAKLSGKLGGML